MAGAPEVGKQSAGARHLAAEPPLTGRRERAAAILGRSGALGAIGAVHRRWSRAVTILAYHRVLDVPDEDAFPFDVELVSASPAQFSRQMEHVRRHHTPITFAALLDCLDRGEPPPRGSAIVTFDDGFADNYDHAFPVLRRLGIPATIFVSTGYLDAQRTFWYEEVTHAIMTTAAPSLDLPGQGRIEVGTSPATRRRAVARVLKALKRMPDAGRLAAVEEIAGQPAGEGGRLDPRSAPLTWEQAREMARHGIEFGSHTVSHPVLSMVAPEKLAHELRESRARIEAELSKPVQVIAYPVGGEEAFNEEVRAAVRAAGYRLGVSYIPGVQAPGSWDRYALRRVRIERYVDGHWFEAMLAAPALFAR
jgi:peptidoglycan/xylan/chitin deacetylase (PgdA/CDA1 family)